MPTMFSEVQGDLVTALPGGWWINYMTLNVAFSLGILRETYRVTYLNMDDILGKATARFKVLSELDIVPY